MGIANRLVPHSQALVAAVHLATGWRAPHVSPLGPIINVGSGPSRMRRLRGELRRGRDVVESGETATGAAAFARGQGRHGAFWPAIGQKGCHAGHGVLLPGQGRELGARISGLTGAGATATACSTDIRRSK
jgi:hypothetical protein